MLDIELCEQDRMSRDKSDALRVPTNEELK